MQSKLAHLLDGIVRVLSDRQNHRDIPQYIKWAYAHYIAQDATY